MRVSRIGAIALSVPVPLPPGGKAHPLAAPFVSYCLVRAETDDGLAGWGEISDGWGYEYGTVATAILSTVSEFGTRPGMREAAPRW